MSPAPAIAIVVLGMAATWLLISAVLILGRCAEALEATANVELKRLELERHLYAIRYADDRGPDAELTGAPAPVIDLDDRRRDDDRTFADAIVRVVAHYGNAGASWEELHAPPFLRNARGDVLGHALDQLTAAGRLETIKRDEATLGLVSTCWRVPPPEAGA
jgi:hypothetical protein